MLFFGIRFLPGILVMFGFYHSVSLGCALPRHVKSWCMLRHLFEEVLLQTFFPIWGSVGFCCSIMSGNWQPFFPHLGGCLARPWFLAITDFSRWVGHCHLLARQWS